MKESEPNTASGSEFHESGTKGDLFSGLNFSMFESLENIFGDDYHAFVLATLLQPFGNHGLGSTLLDEFTDHFHFDFQISPGTQLDLNYPIPPSVEQTIFNKAQEYKCNIHIHDTNSKKAIFIVFRLWEYESESRLYNLVRHGFERYGRHNVKIVYITHMGKLPSWIETYESILLPNNLQEVDKVHLRGIKTKHIKTLSFINEVIPWLKRLGDKNPNLPVSKFIRLYCKGVESKIANDPLINALTSRSKDKTMTNNEGWWDAIQSSSTKIFKALDAYFKNRFSTEVSTAHFSPVYSGFTSGFNHPRFGPFQNQTFSIRTELFYLNILISNSSVIELECKENLKSPLFDSAMLRCGFKKRLNHYRKPFEPRDEWGLKTKLTDERILNLINTNSKVFERQVKSFVINTFEKIQTEFELIEIAKNTYLANARFTSTHLHQTIDNEHLSTIPTLCDAVNKLKVLAKNDPSPFFGSFKLEPTVPVNICSSHPRVLVLELLPPNTKPKNKQSKYATVCYKLECIKTERLMDVRASIPKSIRDKYDVCYSSLLFYPHLSTKEIDLLEKTKRGFDFVQGQLDLTLETIREINPYLIVVIGDDAKKYFKTRRDKPYIKLQLTQEQSNGVLLVRHTVIPKQIANTTSKLFFCPSLDDLTSEIFDNL